MQRSMQLGHCICDPKKPALATSSATRTSVPAPANARRSRRPVRLTELSESSGCGSKIDQATLQRILAGLPRLADPRVLVGMPAGDDAGVYQLDEQTALVQTVDVFSPPVDDPYLFGQIAAANSLSDVYAMGAGRSRRFRSSVFPCGGSPMKSCDEILRGGLDKMAEAGVPVIGGHSIKENEIKAGFAVTGLVDPRRIASNAAAQPGDRLVLTKPLGTGIVVFAGADRPGPPAAAAAAAQSMAALTAARPKLMGEFDAHACTDITGFGLMGHLKAMAAASRVDVELDGTTVPLLPGVLRIGLAAGFCPAPWSETANRPADALAASSGARALLGHALRRPDLGRLADRGARGRPPRASSAGCTPKGWTSPRSSAACGRGTGRVFVRGQGKVQAPFGEAPSGPCRQMAPVQQVLTANQGDPCHELL